MKKLDCRNMACPMPVVKVKRSLEEAPGEDLQVLLDDGAPMENVTRFAVNRGYAVKQAPVEGGYALVITGGGGTSVEAGREKGGALVVFITSDRLGDGPEELGRLLMKNFIISLLDVATVPDRMLFVNTGIFLTTEGSEVAEALTELGNRGAEVLSCGLCLDFFHRKERLVAGAVGNMFTITESLVTAGSVVRP
jgi:selenium metabolism protein YedF